jgi:hypothetical protein
LAVYDTTQAFVTGVGLISDIDPVVMYHGYASNVISTGCPLFIFTIST